MKSIANLSKLGMTALTLGMSMSALAGTQLRFITGQVATKSLPQMYGTESDKVRAQEVIVQFKNPVTEANKALLTGLGVDIYRYMPEDALVVKATPLQLQKLVALPGVYAVVPYLGAYKLSPHFDVLSVFSKNQYENILISAFTQADAKAILSLLKRQDPEVRLLDIDGRHLAIRARQSLIAGLANIDGVEFAEPMSPMQPLHMDLGRDAVETNINTAGDYTDLTGFETGTKVMNLDAAWAQGYKGEGQIVSMADTGLDSGNVSTLNKDFQGAVSKGYSFGVGAKTWDDPMGHGTHVAGSVLGRGTTSGGLLTGSAPKAQFIPEGMWSPIVDNLTVPPKLNKLFDAAYADGARIHTNSWGAARSFGAYDGMAQQVDDFMWNHPDFLILFAAGNSGVDMDKDGRIDPNSIGSPGTAKSTLTVGASENLLSTGGIQRYISELKIAKDNWPAEPIWSSKLSDNAEGIAVFSSRGPTQDGRIKPEIMGPGTNILSVKSSLLKPEDNFWGAYNKDYMYSGGTSMATPLVAGAAAVTREVLVKKFKIANPSAALVKAALVHTAHDMYPGQYGGGATQEIKTHRPNNDEGYGRTDMAQLVALGDATKIVDSADGIAQGETYSQTVVVKEGGSLLANLVYTDAPGTPSAGATLVNDLDLQVTNSQGEVITQNDHTNPHEVIELSSLKGGSYVISVKGTKVPMGKAGKQPFALISTVR